MKVDVDVAEYSPEHGIRLTWEPGYRIRVTGLDVHIVANPEGLRTLARHLLTLAQSNVPIGAHIHLDEMNGLDDGSCGLIVERS